MMGMTPRRAKMSLRRSSSRCSPKDMVESWCGAMGVGSEDSGVMGCVCGLIGWEGVEPAGGVGEKGWMWRRVVCGCASV